MKEQCPICGKKELQSTDLVRARGTVAATMSCLLIYAGQHVPLASVLYLSIPWLGWLLALEHRKYRLYCRDCDCLFTTKK